MHSFCHVADCVCLHSSTRCLFHWYFCNVPWKTPALMQILLDKLTEDFRLGIITIDQTEPEDVLIITVTNQPTLPLGTVSTLMIPVGLYSQTLHCGCFLSNAVTTGNTLLPMR